jgi:hypothetical protein
MRIWALVLLLFVITTVSWALPDDQIAFEEAEYIAAYKRAAAVKSASHLLHEKSCQRRIGLRAAEVLTQACMNAADGGYMRCSFGPPESCALLVDKLDRFCKDRAVEGIPCTYSATPGL